MAKVKRNPVNGVRVKKHLESETFKNEMAQAVVDVLTKQAPVNANGAALVGILGGDGKFRSSKTIKGLTVVNKNSPNAFSLNLSGNKPEEGIFSYPKAIQDDEDRANFSHDRDGTIRPPWDMGLLKSMFVSNEMHFSCIDTKATDITGTPFNLELTDEAKDAKFTMKDKDIKAAYQEATQFLSRCAITPKSPLAMPVNSALKEGYIDHEAMGMMSFEVLRNAKGFIGAVSPIPGQTVLVLNNKEAEKRNGCTYLQKRGTKGRYFLPFMGVVEFTNKNFNPLTSPLSEFPKYTEREKFIKRKRTLPAADVGDEETDSMQNAATELFVLQRAPFTTSTTYGTPAAVAAFPAILGQAHLDEYNLNFFTSKGIPQYAVIIEGLTTPAVTTPDEGEDDNDPTTMMEATVREFFEENLEKAERGVMVMSTFGTAKVRFEKLSAEQVEGSFDKLDARYSERIRLAHQVPPAALGIGEGSTLGAKKGSGNGRELSQMQRYREHIVSPQQIVIASIIESILRGGLLIPYFKVCFQPMAIDDEVMQRTFLLDEYKQGGLTPNEYRLASSKYSHDDRPPIGKLDDDKNAANWIFLPGAQNTIISPDGIQTTAPGDTPNQSGKPANDNTSRNPAAVDRNKPEPKPPIDKNK